jgi:predicted nucleic acid-binding protein
VILFVYGAKERQIRGYQNRQKTGDCEVQDKVWEDGLLQGSQDLRAKSSCSFPRQEEMKRIYLDSNILIAYHSLDRAEEPKKKMVEEAFAVFAELKDVQLCTSMWAVTEMVNILVSSKKMDRGTVAEIESQLVSEKRLKDLKIQIVDVSPQKDYDFAEFFYHVKQGILKYHSGVGDVIHSVIMKNNGVADILTFDEKDDFKQIPDLTVLHPRDIRIET